MSCNYICPTPIEQVVENVPDEGYSPFYFSEEGDTLLFRFTASSFTRVLSALINGAQLTYGEEGRQVVWDFLVNVEYPIGEPMSCEEIIDCVENDNDTQHAIEDMLEENTDFQEFLTEWIEEHPSGIVDGKNKPLPPDTRITVFRPDCDLDFLWAQSRALVTTAKTMIDDFLDQWETYTNQGEVVSDIVNAIPLVSEAVQATGIAGILEYANDLVDSIAENFEADYTLEYEIELACAIFCEAQRKDCVVTATMAAGILNKRIGNALTLGNAAELIVSLMDQDITGFNVADLYMAAFFDFIAIANLVIPTTWGYDTFLRVMFTYDEGNNDWETLCTDCGAAQLDIVPLVGWGGVFTSTFVGISIQGYEIWDMEMISDTGFPTIAFNSVGSATAFYIRDYEILAGEWDCCHYDQDLSGDMEGFDPSIVTHSASTLSVAPYIGAKMRLALEPIP